MPAANIAPRAALDRTCWSSPRPNLRSTVHRPGYLDYIGVKRFDARGRPIGETRILGLWNSSAYRADPRQVPWLRHKLKRVVEHFPFAPNSHDGKRLQHIRADRCRVTSCSRPASPT